MFLSAVQKAGSKDLVLHAVLVPKWIKRNKITLLGFIIYGLVAH